MRCSSGSDLSSALSDLRWDNISECDLPRVMSPACFFFLWGGGLDFFDEDDGLSFAMVAVI